MIATPTPPGVGRDFAFLYNGRVVYKPFPKQVQYHQSPALYPLYGGSKGCGKSKAIRFDCYGPCLAVPGLKCLILRRKKLEMQRSHLRFVRPEAQALGAIWRPNEVGAGVMRFPATGSLIEFGHCTHEGDIEQYLSAEYDRIEIDEIVTFTEEMYLAICTAARTTIPGLIPRVGGGTNPVVKKTHSGYWAKRRWILKDVTPEEDEDYTVDDYDYIAALPTDNPYLNWQQYQRQLNRLPPSLRAAYRDGDWDASEDGFFSEFRKVDKPPLEDEFTHQPIPRKAHVVDFQRIPTALPRHRGLDWGYMTDEGVCLWAVFHPDGHVYVEDEYVFNGRHRDRLIVREVAAEIVRFDKAAGLSVARTYADPKMHARLGHDTVETVMETFGKHGVRCVEGERNREHGWARLRAWLRNHPDGTPFLQIHPRCKYLIRTFGEVSVDDHNDHDLDTHGPDHALDALRFLLASRAAPVEEPRRSTPPPGTVAAMIAAELQRANRPSPLGHLNVQGARHHG